MLIGVIADDFTGASDIANTLTKGLPGEGGLLTAQYMGVPQHDSDADIEAGVVALKSRSISAGDAVAQSLAALEWLLAQGCRQIVFKYCSTFDSTPDGNIGPVAEALAERLGVKGVVVCPAFPGAGRTIYRGHLFVHDRLLSESGMEKHPLTPMTDPDIRRWLSRQTKAAVGLVTMETVGEGPEALRTALMQAGKSGETLVVTDAISNADLATIGAACADAPLITGGSGVAMALPANFIRRGEARGAENRFAGIEGAEAILAGSCSGATRRQIDVHAQTHPTLAIDVDAVMSGQFDHNRLLSFLENNRGRSPLAYSSGDPATVTAAQEKYGREVVADRLDALFGETARALVAGGVRRLVIAGGETSGAVVQALDLGALRVGPEIDPGVPILANAEGTIALALKSGNFGSEDFLAKALDAMVGR
ncbi:four-carbon acid sugar kinase family protein [Corticibacterium sp. UT-5YL-CI-8]|nr:four-carbon acid sugar kinase family protein [Tianweitania sp. UT-5YL-CI-8]